MKTINYRLLSILICNALLSAISAYAQELNIALMPTYTERVAQCYSVAQLTQAAENLRSGVQSALSAIGINASLTTTSPIKLSDGVESTSYCSNSYSFFQKDDGKWDAAFEIRNTLNTDWVVLFTTNGTSCNESEFQSYMQYLFVGENFVVIPYACVKDPRPQSYLSTLKFALSQAGFKEGLLAKLKEISLLRPMPLFDIERVESELGMRINATVRTPAGQPFPQPAMHLFFQAPGEPFARQITYAVGDANGKLTYFVRNRGTYYLVSSTDPKFRSADINYAGIINLSLERIGSIFSPIFKASLKDGSSTPIPNVQIAIEFIRTPFSWDGFTVAQGITDIKGEVNFNSLDAGKATLREPGRIRARITYNTLDYSMRKTYSNEIAQYPDAFLTLSQDNKGKVGEPAKLHGLAAYRNGSAIGNAGVELWRIDPNGDELVTRCFSNYYGDVFFTVANSGKFELRSEGIKSNQVAVEVILPKEPSINIPNAAAPKATPSMPPPVESGKAEPVPGNIIAPPSLSPTPGGNLHSPSSGSAGAEKPKKHHRGKHSKQKKLS